jgi:hypothetical protein
MNDGLILSLHFIAFVEAIDCPASETKAVLQSADFVFNAIEIESLNTF